MKPDVVIMNLLHDLNYFKYVTAVGPLAGPVVAVACIIRPDVLIEGIMDSKQTKESDREATYLALSSHPGVRWGACRVEPAEIDSVNILQASLNAMRRATVDVLKQVADEEGSCNASEYLALIDGNQIPKDMPVACKTVIKVCTVYLIENNLFMILIERVS